MNTKQTFVNNSNNEQESNLNKEIRLIAENLPNVIWKAEITPAGELVNVYISEIADDILELPRGTINNSIEKFYSYLLSDDQLRVNETITRALANPGNVFTFSYQVKKGNSQVAWFESTIRVNDSDQNKQVFGFTVDITEQKKIENRLKENEYLLQQAQKLADIGSYSLDIQTGYWASSENMDAIFGIDDNYIRNVETWLQIVYPDDRPIMYDYFINKVIERKQAFDKQYRIQKIDTGEVLWVHGRGKLEFDESGNAIKMIGTIQNISDQKLKELELLDAKAKAEESTERFELAMQVTLDGPYDWNLVTNEIYFSDRWKEILGYKPDELPNNFSVWEKLTDPDGVKKSYEMLTRHIAGELDKFELEFKMKHKNGHWVDILSRAIAHFNAEGKAVRVVGTHIDITESKKAEKQLKENEIRFRKLIEHLPIGIAIYEAVDNGNDFKFIDVNNTALAILNSSKKELIGHTILNSFSDKFIMPLFEVLRKVHATGKDKFIPSFYYKDSIREGWRENYIYKLQTGEIVAIFRDTTELKNAEESLKKQNAELIKAKLTAEHNQKRFKALHDASFGGIAIHDRGKIIDCNRGLSKLTGLKRKELIGMDGLLLIAKRSRKMVFNRILAEYKKPYEAIGLRKNGEEYPLRIEGRMIPYEGKTVRVVEFRDISDIKRAEYELIDAKEKAEESDRLKSAFLANMSHEIRTPMNGILGFTSLLQEPGLTGEQLQSYINIIKKSGDRMLQTVNDIIEVSKIETGQVTVSLAEVNVWDLLDFQYNFFKPEAERKGLKLFVEKDSLMNEHAVYTDEIKLNSILINLIKNAIKYSSKGSITIACKKTTSHIRFSVKDEGIGIPANRQIAIFDRFVQADIEDRRVHQGSGLGLTITKSYANMLGGEVWVESNEGKGSTFYATIAYNPAIYPRLKSNTGSTEFNTERANLIRIIVAEDDDVSFILLHKILSDENCNLTRVNNGQELVDTLKQNSAFDLVLVDLKMPKMDGIMATKLIRSFNKVIPIIAQTAYALEGDREKALTAGCTEYITKPIVKATLLEIVKRYA
ncbi:PAS domain-containing protein [Prolixibacteraceae bacterium Z1-6]|uniref:histidine kinase n=1 Tax=Draconibacterium aestuarii TaxID=2998507 RepID=A0A9X3F9Q9_9BACT|nr:PAS domain-containing protein [Prolixibacteraceae bacterium Z1-6]